MRAPGFFLAPRPNCYPAVPFNMKYPGMQTCQCADFLEERDQERDFRPARRCRAGAHPGLGRFRRAVRMNSCRNSSEKDLRQEQHASDGGRSALRHGSRTGKMFAMEHWDVTIPDITTLGKGFGNGFPVTAMCVSDKYKDADREDLRIFQLRRQPHGLRGSPCFHRNHRGRDSFVKNRPIWAKCS